MSELINGILAAEELLASRIAALVKTHPLKVATAVGAALLCAGGGAFAVASLEPTSATSPAKEILEAVAALPIESQLSLLDEHPLTLFRTEQTRSGDTAPGLLGRLGVSDSAAAAFVRGNAEARQAFFAGPGRTISAEVGRDKRLRKLTARWIPDGDGGFKRFVVEARAGGFSSRTEPELLSPSRRLVSAQLRGSLRAALNTAGVPEAVATQLNEIFADASVDTRQLRKGDRFALVYETFEADGQLMRSGRVLAAEIESAGKLAQVVWFQEPGHKNGSYYRPNGESLRRAFLTSPVEHGRVSSDFAARVHPILKSWRQHNGIDYAAPTGTSVSAVGDGVVSFAGRQGGYGNMVIVDHRNNQQTAYAHLSRIDVQEGERVSQGERLGAVGATGWATGPHLHFEFRIKGEYVDPATIAMQGAEPISAATRPIFERAARAARTELAAAQSTVVAGAE